MSPRTALFVLPLLGACVVTPETEPAAVQSSTERASVEVIPLEYASASQLADTLGELFETGGHGSGREVKILADERTNALLVSAPPSRIAALKDLIALLDVDVASAD